MITVVPASGFGLLLATPALRRLHSVFWMSLLGRPEGWGKGGSLATLPNGVRSLIVFVFVHTPLHLGVILSGVPF